MLLHEYFGSVLHQKFNIENYNSIYEDLMKNRVKKDQLQQAVRRIMAPTDMFIPFTCYRFCLLTLKTSAPAFMHVSYYGQ
jgi:hypothetical protein